MMYVCICIYIYIITHIYICVYAYVYIYMYIWYPPGAFMSVYVNKEGGCTLILNTVF